MGTTPTPGFWSQFGTSLAQSEAKKSPLAGALFAAMAGRYGKGGQQTPAGSDNPSQATQYGAIPPTGKALNSDMTPAASERATSLQPVSFADTTPKEPDAKQGASFGPPPSPTINLSIGAVKSKPGSYGGGGFPTPPIFGPPASVPSGGGRTTTRTPTSTGDTQGTTWDGTVTYPGGGSETVAPGTGQNGSGGSQDTFPDTPPGWLTNSPNGIDNGIGVNSDLPIYGPTQGYGANPYPGPTSGGGGYDFNNTGGNDLPLYGPTQGYGGNPYDPGFGGGSGSSGGDGGAGDLSQDNFALGGVASRNNQRARIAESGPEIAGGQIVTSPSIVSLKKGDTVIPLTPRAGNKMQPDLLEGHVAAQKAPGLQFSRFQRYGSGRGLMK